MMDPEREIFIPHNENSAEKGDITSDFNYNNNVASCDIYVRMGFLRKVYGLLSVQLLLTAVVSAVCAYTPQVRHAIHTHPGVLLACFPLTIVILIALHVKRHHVPVNYFLLAGFTVLESVTVGTIVSLYEVESVLKAVFMTLVIVVGLTVYTLQSKRDFSKMGTALFICLVVLLGMGLINIFVASKGLDLVLAAVGALLFSAFIVFDTHMLMKTLSPEEYILATINLYLDIINLFLELLRLFGERR